jgi:hypothetical protein
MTGVGGTEGSTTVLTPSRVMAGLVPATHVFETQPVKDVDARRKAGHDGGGGGAKTWRSGRMPDVIQEGA